MTKPEQFESMGALLGALRGQRIGTLAKLHEVINHEAPTIAKAHGLNPDEFGRFIRRNMAVILEALTNKGENKQ